MVFQEVAARVGGWDNAKSGGREVRKEDICDILEMGQVKERLQHANCCRAEYETGGLYSENWRGVVKSSS